MLHYQRSSYMVSAAILRREGWQPELVGHELLHADEDSFPTAGSGWCPALRDDSAAPSTTSFTSNSPEALREEEKPA